MKTLLGYFLHFVGELDHVLEDKYHQAVSREKSSLRFNLITFIKDQSQSIYRGIVLVAAFITT